MEPLTIRIPEDLRESLDEEADVNDVSVSEYTRTLIERGREYDDLRDRLDAREDRIEELENQLRERHDIKNELQDLPDKIRDVDTYTERRQKKLDRASLPTRLKWKLTGVPVDEAA
jgi:uncharacterized coiled-coil DUF342 family protein